MAAPAMKQSTMDYLTIRSVEYHDVTDQYRLKALPAQLPLSHNMQSASQSLSIGLSTVAAQADQVEYIVDKIINVGKKIWTVVEKGHPNQNYQNSVANALPANANTWTDLENWKQPETKVISVSYKNTYGAEVVKFVYRIILLSGGTANGVGNYIGYAAVEPVTMSTSYLYTFNAEAVVVNIFNKGTKANPVAGMILTVRWNVETVMKKMAGSHTFFMDGLGHIDAAEKAPLK